MEPHSVAYARAWTGQWWWWAADGRATLPVWPISATMANANHCYDQKCATKCQNHLKHVGGQCGGCTERLDVKFKKTIAKLFSWVRGGKKHLWTAARHWCLIVCVCACGCNGNGHKHWRDFMMITRHKFAVKLKTLCKKQRWQMYRRRRSSSDRHFRSGYDHARGEPYKKIQIRVERVCNRSNTKWVAPKM